MVNGALTIVQMCAYCPFPPLILHSLLDEDICSILSQWILFSRSQYTYQVWKDFIFYTFSIYLFLQNLTWWWWIFSRTMQPVILRRWKKILQRERNDFGQNQHQLSVKFIGPKGRWGRQVHHQQSYHWQVHWHLDHSHQKPTVCFTDTSCWTTQQRNPGILVEPHHSRRQVAI